jgi:hypothetical protein
MTLEDKMKIWMSGFDHGVADVLAMLPADTAAEVRQKLAQKEADQT